MKQRFIEAAKKYIVLTKEEEGFLLSQLTLKSYRKGDVIVKSGETCKVISYIVSGCVKTSYLDLEGNEHILFFGIENWWTGDTGSFYSQTPADYTVECLEDTVVIQNTLKSLEEIYAKVPKMERFFRIIVQNAYVNLQRKLIQHLSLTAKERYLIFNQQYSEIEKRVPNYMIASYLGVTKEFFSKMKRQLFSKEH